MMRHSLLLGVSLLLATTAAAGAEIYTWTDDQGTVHFTEDRAAVPPKHRDRARRAGDNGETGAATTPAAQDGTGEATAPAAQETGVDKASERFDFTTRDQWQEELQKQEAAMAVLRQRLDDVDATVRTMPKSAERDKLLVEHQTLLAEFKTMKERYQRLVEAARKAGFQVDLQQ